MKDLEEDYRRAGFGVRMGFGKRPALLLVDFVGAYFLKNSPLYSPDVYPVMRAALESALRLREHAHRKGIPVYLTKVELTPTEIDTHLMFRKTKGTGLFEKGSELADFAEGLLPREDEVVINKHYASSFFGTPLSSMLAATGIDSVIITGLSTSGCVRATCNDSVSHGYLPIVVSDAVADRDPRPHEANLFDMGAKYADVVTEEEASAYLDELQLGN